MYLEVQIHSVIRCKSRITPECSSGGSLPRKPGQPAVWGRGLPETDAAVVLPSPPKHRKWPSCACRVRARIIVFSAKIYRRIWALCSSLISLGAQALKEELRAFLILGIRLTGARWLLASIEVVVSSEVAVCPVHAKDEFSPMGVNQQRLVGCRNKRVPPGLLEHHVELQDG